MWLVPVWTTKVVSNFSIFFKVFEVRQETKILFNKQDEAVTGMQLVVQSERNEAYTDLAGGAGGKYRYFKMLRDRNSHTKIKRVGLLRSPKSKFIYGDRKDHGWDECTHDINADRSGDFLHLCWNTVTV